MLRLSTFITLGLFLALPLLLLSDRIAPFAQKEQKGFVVGDLFGQLGNQMFQIAATVSYALDNNLDALFPDLAYSKEFGIPRNAKEVFSHLNSSGPCHKFYINYYERAFTYSPLPADQTNLRIHGYFQSWKYFDHHRQYIQDLFAPNPSILAYLQERYADIISDQKSVSIHVRTYNKPSDDPNHLIYATNGREYVSKAVRQFPEDYNFYVFSDDIDWCKECLAGVAKNLRFIEGESYLHDFYLQALCRHNIISNSTFSWWAAYLNKNPEKVVAAPDKWFQDSAAGLDRRDLLPDDWIVICD